MDAIKFIKERDRMCKSYYDAEKGYCSEECPALNIQCVDLEDLSPVAKKLVEIVEEWSAAHPRKTKQSVLLEQYPNAPRDCGGVLMINPCDLDITIHGKDECYTDNCLRCRHEYWPQEVE